MSGADSNGKSHEHPVELVFVFVANVAVTEETEKALLRLKSAQAAAHLTEKTAAPLPSGHGNTSEPDDPWLYAEPSAGYVGVSVSTLYKYCSQKRIEYRKVAGRLQFRKSTLDQFMAEQIHPARARGDSTRV